LLPHLDSTRDQAADSDFGCLVRGAARARACDLPTRCCGLPQSQGTWRYEHCRSHKLQHPRVAILVVNGFDRRGRSGQYNEAEALDYPWIDRCLRQIAGHSHGWDYEVLVFDNSHLKLHRKLMSQYRHVRVLPGSWVAALGRIANHIPVWHIGRLLERPHQRALDYLVSKVSADFGYIITLDTDSFPVRDDWLDVLVGECERDAALTGVYRNEMAPTIDPFVHVSGLCVRQRDLRALHVSFGRRMGQRRRTEHHRWI
jgi:hypothetical protein